MGAWLLMLALASPTVASRDACEAQVPVTLHAALLEAYPDYRLPRLTDNPAEDVAYARAQGAHGGCLGVAIADFDGDDRSDLAIALTARHGDGGAVIAATDAVGDWQLHEIARWKHGRSRLYVEPVLPDTWHSFFDETQVLAPDEVFEMTCANEGFMFGAIEASGTVACLQAERWRLVHVSD
jgi:hypothetical protein